MNRIAGQGHYKGPPVARGVKLEAWESVDEIEIAIDRLPPEEYRRIVDWLRSREQSRWDEQIDRDSAAGKLDFLFAEADNESTQGILHDWPPAE